MKVQPYLFFDGRCDEAIAFYRATLGAEVDMLMRFSENPDVQGQPAGAINEACMMPPGSEDKVMHCSFRIGETTIMASDGRCSGQSNFQGISLSISVPNDAKAEQLFTALADGGQVQMPMTKTFFASSFGVVADRFGVSWMIHADLT